MKKYVLRAVLLAVLGILIVSPVVYAYTYYASIRVAETDGNSYTYFPFISDIDNDYLADNNYIASTGLDTRVTSGGTELQHLVTDDKTLFVIPSLSANSVGNFQYELGESVLDDMPIILGYDGYITISDDVDLELGDDFEIEFDGYVDTSSGSDKNLVYKEDAFICYIPCEEKVAAGLFEAYYPDEDAETTSVDGYARFNDPGGQAWAVAVAHAGNVASDDDDYVDIGSAPVGFACDTNVNEYSAMSRGIFLFDTSDLPDACTIIGATLYIYGSAALNEGSWDDTTINIYSSAPALDTAVAAGDYDSLGSTPFCDTGITIGDWSTTGYNAFALNASGLAAVSATDITKFGARTSYDVSGTDPGWSTEDALHFGCYFAENAGTDKDPMLVVTYGVQVTDVSSGVHTIKAYADGTNLGIIVDEGEAGEVSDTTLLSGASVPDNANDIIINQNNVLPYFDYLKWTVSDTLIAWYQPATMVENTGASGEADSGSTTTLVDDALTQDDDYWNFARLIITETTDNEAPEGESAVITDFDDGTDELTFGALTAAVGAGDSYTVDFGTLVDRQGDAENGIMTWGSNPAGVADTVGQLISANQPSPGIVGDPDTEDILPAGSVPSGGVVDTETLKSHPFYPAVSAMTGITDFTEEQIWFGGATIIILMAMIFTVIKFRQHLVVCGISGLILAGLFVAQGIYQWWMLIPFVGLFVVSIVMERKPVI